MPAKKPSALNKPDRHRSKSAARAAGEDAMTPRTALSMKAPKALAGHKLATSSWSRLRALYASTEGHIVSAFDSGILERLCLLDEECVQLAKMRDDVGALWQSQVEAIRKLKITVAPQGFKAYFEILNQANALLQRWKGLDARLDAKRALLHKLAQDLYLTPRARSGVSPKEKPAPKPKTELEKLIDG